MYRNKIYNFFVCSLVFLSFSSHAIRTSYFERKLNRSEIKNSYDPSQIFSKSLWEDQRLSSSDKRKIRLTLNAIKDKVSIPLKSKDIENIYKIIKAVRSQINFSSEDCYSVYIRPERGYLKFPLQIFKNNRNYILLRGIDKGKNKGSYKRFYRSYETSQGKLFASLESTYTGRKDASIITKELEIMERLTNSHYNLTFRDYDICRDGPNAFFIMHTELYTEDLSKPIKRNDLSYKEKISIALQASKSLQELHKLDIIHRDVKEKNFLIKKENGKLKLSLIDYGLSKSVDEDEETFGIAGTRGYIDPYICKKRHGLYSNENLKRSYNLLKSSDIFSLGVVFHQMFYPKEEVISGSVYTMNLYVLPKFGSGHNSKLKSFQDDYDRFKKIVDKSRFQKLVGD